MKNKLKLIDNIEFDTTYFSENEVEVLNLFKKLDEHNQDRVVGIANAYFEMMMYRRIKSLVNQKNLNHY